MSRSSDLKECFLRSQHANHKNRPTPLICHINKSKAFSDAAMGTVRAHPTSVVKICRLGRLIIANVTIIIMSSCHAMLLSYFVINYQDQNILSVSLWSLKLRRTWQHQHFWLPGTFWSSECKPSGWRFWLLTIKKIEVGALFPISYFLRQIPKKTDMSTVL